MCVCACVSMCVYVCSDLCMPVPVFMTINIKDSGEWIWKEQVAHRGNDEVSEVET